MYFLTYKILIFTAKFIYAFGSENAVVRISFKTFSCIPRPNICTFKSAVIVTTYAFRTYHL